MKLVPRQAFYRALGELLRARRRELGLTQPELAASVNASIPTICHAERAYAAPLRRSVEYIRSYGEPHTPVIYRMAKALGLEPGALLREAAATASAANGVTARASAGHFPTIGRWPKS